MKNNFKFKTRSEINTALHAIDRKQQKYRVYLAVLPPLKKKKLLARYERNVWIQRKISAFHFVCFLESRIVKKQSTGSKFQESLKILLLSKKKRNILLTLGYPCLDFSILFCPVFPAFISFSIKPNSGGFPSLSLSSCEIGMKIGSSTSYTKERKKKKKNERKH